MAERPLCSVCHLCRSLFQGILLVGSHFLNINRGSLYTKSLRRIHFSVLYEELNIAFPGISRNG